MDKHQRRENVPPAKKLKQATLNFFKASPTSENAVESKANKRKNSSPAYTDSPNKTAKLSKPLAILTEPPNSPSKQTKVIKTPIEPIINDHEVSSSSEADSGSSKTSSGKCCLMERFVCKRVKENQDISSTNDVDKKSTTKKSGGICEDENEEADCIILDDEVSVQSVKDESETLRDDVAVHKMEGTETLDKICKNEVVNADGEEHVRDTEDNREVAIASSKDDKCTGESLKKQNECEKIDINESKENLDSSVNESSFISDCGVSSTPPKLNTSKNKELELSVHDTSLMSEASETSTPGKQATTTPNSEAEGGTSSNAVKPKTPASAKRGRKVDIAKKAEKEAEKQRQKMEREQQRLEKKQKLEEEKAEKERIKKEKKEAREKEKQQQQEKLLREKEEKERLKETERQKKEEERKKKEEEREEEKKKKQAALEEKMGEKRKKEEEKKQKEEEKFREEEEKKKKAEKTKQAFQSFFIKPKENSVKPVVPKVTQGKFVPFELKKDMHLAPATRRDALSEQTKSTVDQVLENPTSCSTTYLKELKQGTTKPHKTGRILRTNPKPLEDIEMVHDPEALKKVLHRVKLLQFHTDHRPPYYGTWRKQAKLSPRNPWIKDETLFDYEVDSDEEWEEEEPGESLSCSDGEDEKGEKCEEDENEDEEDGWMVPHGYLSEDEGCNEDDEITPEKLKLQQLAKAKAWEEEQKRKLQAVPLIAVGCFFEHTPSPQMAGDVRLLYEFRGVLISPDVPIATSLFGCLEQEVEEVTTPDKTATTPSQRTSLKKAVPDEAMPHLIRLVHGNTCGIKRLIREFRIFWLKETRDDSVQLTVPKEKDLDKNLQENDADVSLMNDSVQENLSESNSKQIEDPTDEDGQNCSISKRQLDIKINAIAVREKRQGFNKTCWYVNDTVLKEFNLEGLVCNSLIQPDPAASAAPVEELTPTPVKDQRSIMDFALSKEELAKKEATHPQFENSQPKTPQRDQKSITDFTLSKEALAKREVAAPKVGSSARRLPASQITPKSAKRADGQMSIMTIMANIKPNVQTNKTNVENSCKTQPTAMETDEADVIIIDPDSTSDVEMSTAPASPNSLKAKSQVSLFSCVPSTSNKAQLNQMDMPSSTNKSATIPQSCGTYLPENRKESSQLHSAEDTGKVDSERMKECFIRLEKMDTTH